MDENKNGNEYVNENDNDIENGHKNDNDDDDDAADDDDNDNDNDKNHKKVLIYPECIKFPSERFRPLLWYCSPRLWCAGFSGT